MSAPTRTDPAVAGPDAAVLRAGSTGANDTTNPGQPAPRTHPARFTPAIVDALAPIITRYKLDVHDPFAGTGERLGALCDRLGVTFTGTDIEAWPGADRRVALGDATDPVSYPSGNHLIVTSPTYGNGVNDHHEARDDSRRYTYRSSLGQALHDNNTGRYGLRAGRASWARYWELHRQAVTIWRDLGWPVVVNVKAFVHAGETVDLPGTWMSLLETGGYEIADTRDVPCPGIRHGANSAARVDHEAILIAEVPS